MAAVADGPAAFLSRRSRLYRKLKDQVDGLSPADLLKMLAAEPTLLRSPILFDGRQVYIGFSEDDYVRFVAAM